MIARWLRAIAMKRELDRRLRERKLVGKARAEAAKRGQHTYWQRSGAQCRAMFG